MTFVGLNHSDNTVVMRLPKQKVLFAVDFIRWDAVEKDLKLPKYESWPGYAAGLPMVLRRYCGLWGRGT